MRATAEWSVAGELRTFGERRSTSSYIPRIQQGDRRHQCGISAGAGTNGLSYPIFKNFYAGGLGSVRGFEQGSLTTGSQRAAWV
jgi:outer membrane protein insertion porin family